MNENVILLDKDNQEVGYEEKIKAHKENKLHMAFSVFVFNSKNELLIQKRHNDKYHSKGLWSNSCCSHPRKGELIEEAAHRRLKEEMGFSCELQKIGSFHYNVELEDGLWENEIDYVFIGKYDGEVNVDESEVEEYRWISLKNLEEDIKKNPLKYTYWFKEALEWSGFSEIKEILKN